MLVMIGLLAASGCASASDPAADDVGDDVEQTAGDDTDTGDDTALTSEEQGLSAGCASQKTIINSAPSAARRKILERGFSWLNQGVPYSQSKFFGGYRTDCSGFISMAWGLKKSETTAGFGAGANSSRLSSTSQLLPGDALNRPSRPGRGGHVVMVLSKVSGTKYCVLEQASTASDMQFRVRDMAGFTPIRKDGL
jgi:hypothetical protein